MKEEDIRKNIKALRESRHISQREMAQRLDIERKTYQDIENGPTRLRVDMLQRIADILEVSIYHLLSGYALQEEDMRNLEEMKMDYNNRIHEKEMSFAEQDAAHRKKLKAKEEEVQMLKSNLKDKDQIITLLEKKIVKETK